MLTFFHALQERDKYSIIAVLLNSGRNGVSPYMLSYLRYISSVNIMFDKDIMFSQYYLNR